MTTPSVLFHYTSVEGWNEIADCGFIKPTSLAAQHLDGQPILIWLQETENPRDSGLSDQTRTVIRISVTPTPSVRYWPVWRELSANWEAVENAGGVPATWYVTDHPITAEQWGKVINVNTGEVLGNPAVAALPVTEWGPLADSDDVDRIADFLERSAADDPFRAHLVRHQIRKLRDMLKTGETEQRLRAGWRTLTSEASRYPNCPPEWVAP